MQRSGNKAANDNADKVYLSYTFGKDRNKIVEGSCLIDVVIGSGKGCKSSAIAYLTATMEAGDSGDNQEVQAANGVLFPESCWPLRISSKFMEQVKRLTDDQLVGYITLIRMLAEGRWPGPSSRNTCFRSAPVFVGNTIPYNSFYIIIVPDYKDMELRLIYSVGVEWPSRHYLKIWAVPAQNELNGIGQQTLIKQCLEQIGRNRYLRGFEDELERVVEKKPDPERMRNELFMPGRGKGAKQGMDQRRLDSDKINQVIPTLFVHKQIRIVEQTRSKKIQSEQQSGSFGTNEEIIKKVIDFKSVRNLIDMMVKIPGFRIKCSEEQKNIIGHNGNIIVMGRSGTGKTTCAILRLFTVQMLFHIRQKLGKPGECIQLRDTRAGKEKDIELHSIFVTASLCLAQEIERYYNQFVAEVKKQTAKKKGEKEPTEESKPTQQRGQALNDISSVMQNMYRMKSMEEMTEKEYPAFMTTRELLFLIDETLAAPFADTKPTEQADDAQYRVARTAIKISDPTSKFNLPNHREVKKSGHTFYSEENHHVSFRRKVNLELNEYREVTFEYFSVAFWPQIRHLQQSKGLTPEVVWTQIISNIKGSISSYIYPLYAEPLKCYLERSQSSLLSDSKRENVYAIYRLYEEWKLQDRGFDLMDVINYVFAKLVRNGYGGPPLHYLMIDEVQDLPYVFILLLSLVVETGVLFCGDSAQTIAKGVQFRFSEIKRMFDRRFCSHEVKMSEPTMMQLSVNFRSHNAILQLSNSVVSVIEVFFPTTIDRMRKQRSDYDGPQPILLAGRFADQLTYFMEAQCKQYDSEHHFSGQRPKLEFGSHRAILVRSSGSKKTIPEKLKKYVCLTIHEAKGLEFDDVLLVNFFDETKVPDQWRLLKHIKVHQYVMKSKDFEERFTNAGREDYDAQPAECDASHLYEGQDVILSKLSRNTDFPRQTLAEARQLCSELKMLYTAITRARNNLIIYDESGQHRLPIEKIWRKLGVVRCEQGSMKERSGNQFNLNQTPRIQQVRAQWRAQGMVMYNRNLMEEALKCFKLSGDEELTLKAEAKFLADSGAKELAEIDAELGQLEKNSNFSRADKRERLNDLRRARRETIGKLQLAGANYTKLRQYSSAGRCFFNVENYEEALECFDKVGDFKAMGQCHFHLKRYLEAADLFLRSGSVQNCLESLDACEQFETALGVLYKFRNLERKEVPRFLEYFTKKICDHLVSDCNAFIEGLQSIYEGELVRERRQQDRRRDQPALLAFIRSHSIPYGYLTYKRERVFERAVGLIAIRSRFQTVTLHPTYFSVKMQIYGEWEELDDVKEPTNEELALEELEYLGQQHLCILLCKCSMFSMANRMSYYVLSQIYRIMKLPAFSETLIKQNQQREHQLKLLKGKIENADQFLLNVLSEVHSEYATQFEREYLSQGLAAMGLYKLSKRLTDVQGLINLFYLYFDGDALMRLVKQDLTSEESSYYADVGYLNGDTPIVTTMVERMIWGAFDSLRLKRYPVLSYCSPLEIEFMLPKQFEHLCFYSQIKSTDSSVFQRNLQRCAKYLPIIVQGVKKVRGSIVYDIVTMGIFMLIYVQEEKSLLNRWTVDDFLAFYQPIKRMISELLLPPKNNMNSARIMESVLSFYRLRLARGKLDMAERDIFGDEFLLMHISSPLMHSLLRKRAKDIKILGENFRQYVYFVEAGLNVVAVPFRLTMLLLQETLQNQLNLFTEIYLARARPQFKNPCEAFIHGHYQMILKGYLYRQSYDYVQESIFELLTFNQTVKFPGILKDYILKLSQQIRYTRANKASHQMLCTLLLASGQIHLYRQIFDIDSRCELYKALQNKYNYDLDDFESQFRGVFQDTSMSVAHKLPLLEELLIVLTEKYLMLRRSDTKQKVKFCKSQLTYFLNLKFLQEHEYGCVENNYINIPLPDILSIIQFYFKLLRDMVRNQQLAGLQRKRIRQIVQMFMVNFGYFGEELKDMLQNFMEILRQSGLSEHQACVIDYLLEQSHAKRSEDLGIYIETISGKPEIVTFQDESDPVRNDKQYRQSIVVEKAHAKVRRQAAVKIQNWWRQIKKEEVLQRRTGLKSMFNDDWLLNTFYSHRRTVSKFRSGFLRKTNTTTKELLGKHWANLTTDIAGRQVHEFHRTLASLRQLSKLRQSYSKMPVPVKMGRVAELEEEFGDVEETLEKWEIETRMAKLAIPAKSQFGKATANK